MDHGLTGFLQFLVVLAQPAGTAKPSKCAFNDPPARENSKTLLTVRALDDLENPVTKSLRPHNQSAGVTTVRPDELEPRKVSGNPHHDQLRAISVLNGGYVYDYCKQESHRVDHDVTLATIDFLSCVITVRATCLGGLHALTVNDGRAGASVPTGTNSQSDAQEVRHLLPPSSEPKLPKVVVYGLPLGKIMGQHAPLATRSHNVEDCVENLLQTNRAWPAQTIREHMLVQQCRERFPLVVGQVGVISMSFHTEPPRLGGLMPPYLASVGSICPVTIDYFSNS